MSKVPSSSEDGAQQLFVHVHGVAHNAQSRTKSSIQLYDSESSLGVHLHVDCFPT